MAQPLRFLLLSTFAALVLSACAGSNTRVSTAGGGTPRLDFFAAVESGEGWHDKVAEWQHRARSAPSTPVPSGLDAPSVKAAERSGRLRTKYGAFQAEEQRGIASRINSWSQVQARRHYRLDKSQSAANDHWPTFGELLDQNGDDCDGLDLIAYEMLLEFGFPPDKVYRSIVRRDRDGRNHMITLWFEDPVDPWVLDATTAMTAKMRRFSELPGWTATAMFNEQRQFGVAPLDRPVANASD